MRRTASRIMGSAARCSLVSLALNLIGCDHFFGRHKQGVPAPDFAVPFDSATSAQILGYVKGKLHFDAREGSSDERPLPVGCPSACRPGPTVAIQPEERTHNNDEAALKKNGRIIAKLINRDQKQGYPEYNLGAGDTVYWAVDRVKRISNVLLEGRSLFISEQRLRANQSGAALIRELYIDDHPGQKPDAQALARWVPRKNSKQGTAVAPAWRRSATQGTTRIQNSVQNQVPGQTAVQTQVPSPQNQMIYVDLMTWNNCKSGGCCR